MKDYIQKLKEKLLKQPRKRIVFPESLDERVIEAASQLSAEGLIIPVLIGNKMEITHKANDHNIHLNLCEFAHSSEHFVALNEVKNYEAGNKNGPTEEELLKDSNLFGMYLVQHGLADGLVSGAVHTTGDTLRPAFQMIGMRDGRTRASGAFVMIKGEQKYIFADCSLHIAPNSFELAEIALESITTAKLFNIEPKIAMLSYSTKGLLRTSEVTRIKEAISIVKRKYPHVVIDGELQFDAAFIPEVAMRKAPESDIQGDATIFIFPDLEAGNIACKIIERLTPYEVIGPILQGFNKPINDLSRGCVSQDIYELAIITAAQAI